MEAIQRIGAAVDHAVAQARRVSQGAAQQPKDAVNLSKVYQKIDAIQNLGASNRLVLNELTPDERETFLKFLSVMLKKGIVGYEMLEVDGIPEKHFIETEIGDHRTYGARPARDLNV